MLKVAHHDICQLSVVAELNISSNVCNEREINQGQLRMAVNVKISIDVCKLRHCDERKVRVACDVDVSSRKSELK